MYIYIYSQARIYISISTIHNHQVRQVFYTWDLNHQQQLVERYGECEQQCSWQKL